MALDSPETTVAKTLGSELFEALFSDAVRDLYRRQMAEADRMGKGLRIMIYLDQTPELMDVPWEYLRADGRFLSLSDRTPISRYLDAEPRKPLPLELPLRIIGMVSSPSEVVELDVEAEKRRLENALQPLVLRGEVEIAWVERATPRELLEALEREEFHVFHYVGFGGLDERSGDGVLLLEDDHGHVGRPISGTVLGELLRDGSVRAVVLNTYEGSRTGEAPFSHVAASLVMNAIPSVVAMQFEMTDRAADVFAEAFYSALLHGLPIDTALARARKAIYADLIDVQWGTPTLFLGVPDGRIFEIRL